VQVYVLEPVADDQPGRLGAEAAITTPGAQQGTEVAAAVVRVPVVEYDFSHELAAGLVDHSQVQPVGPVGAGQVKRANLLQIEAQMLAAGIPADLRILDDRSERRQVIQAEGPQDHLVARENGLDGEVGRPLL
jgi:hypothetical protein